MSTPGGWYPDPVDSRVQRFWNGAAWTGQRMWNGTQWVEIPPLGALYAQSDGPGAPPPRRRRSRAGWWIGGLALVVIVGIVIAVAASGGGSGNGTDRQAFCGNLKSALPGLNNGNIVHVTQGGDTAPYTADEKSTMQAAIDSAKRLSGEAPDIPKRYLEGLARGLSANLSGREDLNVDDDVDVQLGQLSAWKAVNCT